MVGSTFMGAATTWTRAIHRPFYQRYSITHSLLELKEESCKRRHAHHLNSCADVDQSLISQRGHNLSRETKSNKLKTDSRKKTRVQFVTRRCIMFYRVSKRFFATQGNRRIIDLSQGRGDGV